MKIGIMSNVLTRPRLQIGLLLSFVLLPVHAFAAWAPSTRQNQLELTRIQIEIEKQKARLSSTEVEDRRDAVMRLGALRRAEASRAALPALADPASIVRVAAAAAVLSLPGEESAAQLIPLLSDKDPFVRQEVAYALGNGRSRNAVSALVERLTTDKEDGVRGAAAVALGMIKDEGAVLPLAQVLSPGVGSAAGNRKRKTKENVFVMRAAAHALGEIRSRAGVPPLIAALANEALADDVRREAAAALGLIADPSAVPALRATTSAPDPYLARIAVEALHKIEAPKQSP